jgi:hypothetical protein
MDGGACGGHLPRVVWHSTENDPANTTAATIAAFLDRLGDGAKWPEIYDLNKSVIGNNPALILPGQQLTIPAA